MNIIQAIEDANLFRPFLADASGSLTSWSRWLVAMKVLYGMPIKSKSDRNLLRECTGRTRLPKDGFTTALFLTGRRSGKSRMAAVAGAFEAVLAGHETQLAKGERGVVLIASPTKSQSRIVRDYLRAIFNVPLLQAEVINESKEGFELRNGTRIEILAGDWRSVRGFTLIAAILDETAFFGYDSESKVKSDTELIRAIRPSLATVGGKLIAISSPYATKGWCYSQYKRNFGNDKGPTLVWNCSSRAMNPTLPQSVVDDAMEDDPASARAEYLGEFRDDVATFLPRDVIEASVVKGRSELPLSYNTDYGAFVDISGGRNDDAALAIAHMEEGKVVLDLIRQWKPPFSPDAVVGEMVAVLGRYHIDRVTGDNYSAEFVKNSFESRGIRYGRDTSNPWSHSPTAKVAKPKSQLYLELLPRLCSGEIELLDNDVLINQLAGLERRTRSGGRDVIDHGPNQHDDVANVCAGVCDVAIRKPIVLRPMFGIGSEKNDSYADAFAARQREYDAEQRALAQEDDDSSGLLDAIRDGRVHVFSHGNLFG